jgi:hypothetical protein
VRFGGFVVVGGCFMVIVFRHYGYSGAFRGPTRATVSGSMPARSASAKAIIRTDREDMPEKVPNKELEDKTVRPEVLPTTPAIPKPQSVELEFDEGDALFRKRTDV